MIIIALVLAALVGASLGLLGGGGSILTVPILTYVLGMDTRAAISASLFIVGTTSIITMVGHARSSRVKWRSGIEFGLAGMAGAFAGAQLGRFLSAAVLMVLFAVMMLTAATAMIRGRKGHSTENGPTAPRSRLLQMVASGAIVGVVTGLVGVGGGFLIVPALVLFTRLPMGAAVGTSLLVIAMNSAAGFASTMISVRLDWPVILAFTAIAIGGSFAGLVLAKRLPGRTLRKAFGVFVLAMGVLVLAQEFPALIVSLNGA